MTSPERTDAATLSSALKEFHQALIRAEIGDDPTLENPYTMLFALIGDPRFQWMSGLSKLIAHIDGLVADREADLAAAMPGLVAQAAALIEDGAHSDATFRLRHLMALQKEPAVGLATGRLRRALADRARG